MSILSELKKLTGKQNAKVVSEALPPVVPTPTISDAGKFLGVNASGEYALANAAANTRPIVHASNGFEPASTLDATYADIEAANSVALVQVVDGSSSHNLGFAVVIRCHQENENYAVDVATTMNTAGAYTFLCSTKTDYPAIPDK